MANIDEIKIKAPLSGSGLIKNTDADLDGDGDVASCGCRGFDIDTEGAHARQFNQHVICRDGLGCAGRVDVNV